MYSRDLDYRKRIHLKIKEILEPFFDIHFKDFENVINTFVVKLPGEKSEFYLHQDTTAIDEFTASPLSLWIPLQDVDSKNGALALVEKTHWFFSPYRGVTIPFPFKNIANTVRKYLKPITLKKGEVLCFDNRIIHNSLENKSGEVRVAVVCGIFPKNPQFISCYQDSSESDYEIYEHDSQYLLEYPQFFYDCTTRPTQGKVVERVRDLFQPMTKVEFEELCRMNDIPKKEEVISVSKDTAECDLIAEPDGVNRFEVTAHTKRKRKWYSRFFNT
jgi:hypothetical protein